MNKRTLRRTSRGPLFVRFRDSRVDSSPRQKMASDKKAGRRSVCRLLQARYETDDNKWVSMEKPARAACFLLMDGFRMNAVNKTRR